MPTERRMLSQPADWWDAFEEAAGKADMHLSEWIGEKCRDELPVDVIEQLSKRERPGRKANPAPAVDGRESTRRRSRK